MFHVRLRFLEKRSFRNRCLASIFLRSARASDGLPLVPVETAKLNVSFRKAVGLTGHRSILMRSVSDHLCNVFGMRALHTLQAIWRRASHRVGRQLDAELERALRRAAE